MIWRSVCALAALALSALTASAAQARDLAIVGAKVYASPTGAAQDNATILVHDGRIVAVGASARVKPPKGAQVVDGKGLVVTAGFWNSHVHLISPLDR